MIKKKKLLVIFVLLIAFFITGCTVPSTYTGSDEAKIESVIKQFFSALNNQNWSKAKSCCVYGSDAYEAICEFENDVNYLEKICGYVKINTYVNVDNISISGNYAYVICDARTDSLGVYYHDFLITQKRGNVKYRRAFRHSSGPDGYFFTKEI